MASDPRNDTADTHQLLWNNWTVLTEGGTVFLLNTTRITGQFSVLNTLFFKVMMAVIVFIVLCGIMGNGIVIWLMSFRMKRNHFSVYILNLAIADFAYLLTALLGIIVVVINNLNYLYQFIKIIALSFCSVGQSLLMAISVERCVSVLRPIWYKCHRPAHLSTIICALIWALFLIFSLIIIIFDYLKTKPVFRMWVIYEFISFPTFLVLFVSSLTLFIRVQCYSRQRKPSRLYWTILLNVLVFLLLTVPRGVFMACRLSMELSVYDSQISVFTVLLHVMNSAVNPIIYFFIGRHGQQGSRKPLREVLQRALMDEDEEAGQRSGSTIQIEYDNEQQEEAHSHV